MIILLFVLDLILARPQYDDDYYDAADECSKFSRESAFDFVQFGYNKTTIEGKLIYEQGKLYLIIHTFWKNQNQC